MPTIDGPGRAADISGVSGDPAGADAGGAPASPAGAANVSRGALPSGRAGVMARVTTAAPAAGPASSEAAFAAHIAAIPRNFDETAETAFDSIRSSLKGTFLNWETDMALDSLEYCDGPRWAAVMDKLATTPGDDGKPLLEKFVDKGLEDRNKFLARFVRQANEKLGLGLPEGCDRDMRLEGRNILAHFGSDARTDLGGVIRTAAEGTVDGARFALCLLIAPFFRPNFTIG